MKYVAGYHEKSAGISPALLLTKISSRNSTFQSLSNHIFSALLFKPERFEPRLEFALRLKMNQSRFKHPSRSLPLKPSSATQTLMPSSADADQLSGGKCARILPGGVCRIEPCFFAIPTASIVIIVNMHVQAGEGTDYHTALT
jgi:hypothetical protein